MRLSRKMMFRARYTVALSILSVVSAGAAVPAVNWFFRPELSWYVLQLGLIVTVIVAPPICYLSAIYYERAVTAHHRLARQRAELAAAKSTAEQAVQAKSRFLAVLSHEIRTPLNGVLGMAQLLAARDLRAEDKILADALLDSGQALMTLLNDILDMSKAEAGRMEILPVRANVADELGRIDSLFRPLAVEKGLDLRISVDQHVPDTLMLDPQRVRQCVSNLVSNAIKFTQIGHVAVTARMSRADMLQITVRDTGPGIPTEAQGRIFEAFAQAGPEISHSHGGTGLGLSISQSLAERMGGGLSVSSAPGQGAAFTLTCAVAPADAFGPAPEGVIERLDGPDHTLHLLVVDDVATNRMVLRLLLERLGARVSEADCGATALDLLKSTPADMVLIDANMPGMSGMEAMVRIRAEICVDLPTILITASPESFDLAEMHAIGFHSVLAKPVSEPDLLTAVLRALQDQARGAA